MKKLNSLSRWWFYRKGSEIWANHNRIDNLTRNLIVGDSTAKVVKFEQITTHAQEDNLYAVLVILPQR